MAKTHTKKNIMAHQEEKEKLRAPVAKHNRDFSKTETERNFSKMSQVTSR